METTGFIGLGAMGAAMAERLQEAGVPLVLCDPNATALEPFVAKGARSGSAREVAEAAEIVFLCLPKAAVSAAVVAEIAGASKAKIVVEMSTIGKAAIEPMAAKLAEAGKVLVDCPVSGGPRGARAGTLAAIVAGAPEAVAAIRPSSRSWRRTSSSSGIVRASPRS
jgi:3-hydroxyisobutyrate dehydrogenase-like beta-hydroxyacid dehydrogenase